VRFFLGLGSNVGDRAAALGAAADGLEARGVHVLRRSSIYETDPVGGPAGQQPYLNQAIEIESRLGARALLAVVHDVEAALGRDRSREERWGPRTIDIDILMGDEDVDEPDLIVPHPRMHERAFVLVPLAEIAPDAATSGGTTVSATLESTDASGVRRRTTGK
jgi:2-amino-4-hydroxy-6-hydroxymethyldihydropteridine diphosphokinase